MLRLVLISVLFPLLAFGQSDYLRNPSFEGVPGVGRFPTNWGPCDARSSPDTQPGMWGVLRSPSHGDTYISMVIRGFLGAWGNDNGSTEDIRNVLKRDLIADSCYLMSVDLCQSGRFGHDFPGYWLSHDSPVSLKIYGGTNMCEKEHLFWTSEPIKSLLWKTYQIVIRPPEELGFIVLEANHVQFPEDYGNILIDNMKLEKIGLPKLMLDTTVRYQQTIVLNASEGSSYYWEPTASFSCGTCQTAELIVEDAATYTVHIQDSVGCTRVEQFQVKVEFQGQSILSPNGDGIQDKFEIRGLEGKTELGIFDRSGKLIYHSTDYKNDWSGTSSNGHPVAAGVYIYRLLNENLSTPYSGKLVIARGSIR